MQSIRVFHDRQISQIWQKKMQYKIGIIIFLEQR